MKGLVLGAAPSLALPCSPTSPQEAHPSRMGFFVAQAGGGANRKGEGISCMMLGPVLGHSTKKHKGLAS